MADEKTEDTTKVESGGDDDVKSKMARLSGSRIRQERADRRAEAAGRSAKKIPNAAPNPPTDRPTPREDGPTEPPASERPASERPASDQPAATAPRETDTGATPPAARQPQRAPRSSERSSVGAPVAIAVGIVLGLIPGGSFAALRLFDSQKPEGIPAEAVQRQHDWIHCDKSVAAQRWTCDVYDLGGEQLGSGEFVPAAGASGTEWRLLAGDDVLVADGEFHATAARSVTLYVRGVAVGSRIAGKQ